MGPSSLCDHCAPLPAINLTDFQKKKLNSQRRHQVETPVVPMDTASTLVDEEKTIFPSTASPNGDCCTLATAFAPLRVDM